MTERIGVGKHANLISNETGAVIGGLVLQTHSNGEVTINFAGLQKRGHALGVQDIQLIESGAWTNEPKLRDQR